MTAHRTHRYPVRGLSLAWHEWGPQEGPVVLCVHGFLDHGRSWAAVGEDLGGELRVVAPDIRGHGESDWVGPGGYYHFYDYFHDVRRLVSHLGDPSVLLVGHSMGGSVVTGVATLLGEKVRGMVLLEGMGPPFSDLSKTQERLRRWNQSLLHPDLEGGPAERASARKVMGSVADAAERLRRYNPRLPAPRARALAESFTEPAPTGGVVWRYDPLHRTPAAKPFVLQEASALWQAIQAPTVSLFGEKGFTPEGLAARHALLTRVRVGTIAGAGHNLHHERPELVADVIRRLHRSGEPGLAPGVFDGEPPS